MYAVSIGEAKITVVGKEDAKQLLTTLLELGCDYRVSYKHIDAAEEQAEEDPKNVNDTNASV